MHIRETRVQAPHVTFLARYDRSTGSPRSKTTKRNGIRIPSQSAWKSNCQSYVRCSSRLKSLVKKRWSKIRKKCFKAKNPRAGAKQEITRLENFCQRAMANSEEAGGRSSRTSASALGSIQNPPYVAWQRREECEQYSTSNDDR